MIGVFSYAPYMKMCNEFSMRLYERRFFIGLINEIV